MFKKYRAQKRFKEELFDELLRFHVEKISCRDSDKEEFNFDWRFYKDSDDRDPFGVESSPYSEVIKNFIIWLVKKQKYDPELVTDYFGYYPEEIYKDLNDDSTSN